MMLAPLLLPLAAALAQAPSSDSVEGVAVSSTSVPVVHGIHITAWAAGSSKNRRRLIKELRASGLNAVVVALKEYDGRIFIRGVKAADDIGAHEDAISDLPEAVGEFKKAGLYTIARIVLFKDDVLARRRPELAIHRPDGKVWTDDKGHAWADPYRREVWEYNLAVASQAAAAGFDEIQFDYIRFPSEGDLSLCRYSRPDHSRKTAAADLLRFLTLARERLKPRGVNLSVAIFGLTTTTDSGMGIGQHLQQLMTEADFVSPMMYPSHYHKGEYGIKNPNRDPYKTIHRGLSRVTELLGPDAARLRPYLQDFSLGYHYRAPEVRAQILAAGRAGVTNWILWNPQNKYTWSAFREPVNQPVNQ